MLLLHKKGFHTKYINIKPNLFSFQVCSTEKGLVTNGDQLACITARSKFGDNIKLETKIGKIYLNLLEF